MAKGKLTSQPYLESLIRRDKEFDKRNKGRLLNSFADQKRWMQCNIQEFPIISFFLHVLYVGYPITKLAKANGIIKLQRKWMFIRFQLKGGLHRRILHKRFRIQLSIQICFFWENKRAKLRDHVFFCRKFSSCFCDFMPLWD